MVGDLVRFQPTVWTVIEAAKRQDPAAIERMISNYSAPLLGFIRNRGLPSEDAEDVLQEVLVRIYNEDFLSKADKVKGKFRSVLLGVTKKCILKYYEKKGALKRGGGQRTISIEELRVNEEGEIPVAAEESSDFNRLWFENIMHLSIRALKDESSKTNKRHFEILTQRLRGRSYAEIAADTGLSETDVTNMLHAARKRVKTHADRLMKEYTSSAVEFKREATLFTEIAED